MRVDDILFRGKRLDNGEWVYGYLFKGIWYYDESDIVAIIPEQNEVLPRCEVEYYEIDSETIGQYIGRDDMNGNKLFTDDLIETYWRHHFGDEKRYMGIHCVVSDSCIDNGIGRCWPQDTLYYKVIGNKYDNPDIYEKMREDTMVKIKSLELHSPWFKKNFHVPDEEDCE